MYLFPLFFIGLSLIIIVDSMKPYKNKLGTKTLIIFIETALSVALPYTIFKFFMVIFSHHYEAQFLEGLVSIIISIITIPIYGKLFAIINKKIECDLSKLKYYYLYSVRVVLLGVVIQIVLFIILDNPFVVHVEGW